ncbi:TPA: integrating conjugative element protein [Escherichia coli]|uniref:integrating conjugative element protein n=1 Tax=Escherichia coli TaxID=562 RepID=UPI000BE19087|nr:integrating conjugative element protein [Escherichia coli]EAC1985336.1 integrating conjugative element protein [Escherichia coli]EEW2595032.1 integrating conjugative element protein [Escherichia coli]EFC4250395.1 integrating conjugative element protein [Escherichia coli]EFI6345169.1 integrating conjugative element protein [Escherichia coli]EFL7039237.1 integrating conjugative element protein [Escherichia coli]
MKRFKRYVMTTATGLLLCAAQAGADLRVIADLGGSDAGRFYEAINRQADSGTSSPVTALLPQGESAMLPVSTPEMSPGEVTPRPLQLPGLGALFLVGDDALSRQWLQANAAALLERKAAGMVVSVTNESGLQALRALAPGVMMVPASGSALARRLQLDHWPVLITDSGISSVVMP